MAVRNHCRNLLLAALVVCSLVFGSHSKSLAQEAASASKLTIANPATPAVKSEPEPQVGPNPTPTPPPIPLSQPNAATPNILSPTAVPVLPVPAQTTPVSTSRNSTRNNNPFSPRLARAAPIMGDTLSPSITISDELGFEPREIPLGGGATRSKIAENSSSLPMDRLIFNYNHFHNAIDDTPTDSTDIDRFTLGYEKTFFEQMMSVEIRMPFLADNDFDNGIFSRNGGEVGNLSVTLKSVLTSDQDSLWAAGLTIDTPTGDGVVSIDNSIANPLTVAFSNDAVHLSPFIGFLCAPSSGNTHQGFVQIDVPTNANTLTFSDVSGANTEEFLEQTLLYLDYSFSKQIYNAGRSARSGCDIRRVLGLAELHYTTTLEDSDVAISGTAANPLFQVSSTGNRLDVLNLTLGLHTEFASGAQLRLGTVTPITDDLDRFFDFEFQAQLNILLR